MSAKLRVDVWCWNLERQDHGALLALLSPQERARADRFLNDGDRFRYIGAHGRLREVLAGYGDRAPDELAIEADADGKPMLRGEPGLHFNFSDSGALGALAIGRAPLGVDIEEMTARDFAALSRRYFAPAERQALLETPHDDRAGAFYRCWTRKEAFLKATGAGLRVRLDGFEVTLGATDVARFTHMAPDIDADCGAWALHGFEPAPGFVGAVAARTGVLEVSMRESP